MRLTATSLQSTPTRHRSALALAVGLVITLSACQSTHSSKQPATGGALDFLTPTDSQSQTTGAQTQHERAKAHLGDVVRHQLRRNFHHHSTLYLSNATRQDALKGVNTQAVEHTNSFDYCESQHDLDYQGLIKQARVRGLDVSADYFLTDKGRIKDAYFACIEERSRYFPEASKQVSSEHLQEFLQEQDGTLQAHGDDVSSDDTDQEENNRLKALYQSYLQYPKLTESSQQESELGIYLADKTQTYSQKDLDKARAIEHYLVMPTAIEITGNYRPLQGMVSLLPSITYRQKNLEIMLNQPIYLDIKNGILYLWADNLALVNSRMIDDKLGTAWQNKWLALPINDGSLPTGFYEDFIKSLLAAQRHTFDTADASDFDYVSSADFEGATAHILNTSARSKLPSTRHIIRQRIQSPSAQRRAMLKHWHTAMTTKYPLLTQANEPDDDQDSAAAVKHNLNARSYMRHLFAYVAKYIERETTDSAQQTFYGVNGTELVWRYQSVQLPMIITGMLDGFDSGLAPIQPWMPKNAQEDTDSALPNHPVLMQDSAHIDRTPVLESGLLTVIDTRPLTNPFVRLPRHANTPNAQNSVQLIDYAKDLTDRLKGQPSNMAQFLLRVLSGVDNQHVSIDSEAEASEMAAEVETAAETAAASVEAVASADYAKDKATKASDR